jgi:hypothetical protein
MYPIYEELQIFIWGIKRDLKRVDTNKKHRCSMYIYILYNSHFYFIVSDCNSEPTNNWWPVGYIGTNKSAIEQTRQFRTYFARKKEKTCVTWVIYSYKWTFWLTCFGNFWTYRITEKEKKCLPLIAIIFS